MGYPYKRVYRPNHPDKQSNDMMMEHRVVAEKMFGRRLTNEEIVHHKDENKLNNLEDNLMVMRTAGDHNRLHAGGEVIDMGDGTFTCNMTIKEKKCIECGTLFSYSRSNAKFCSHSCSEKNQRIVERPSKEILNKELTETNFSAVGRKYGVSDNAIRKWCRSYGMPTKAKDYK